MWRKRTLAIVFSWVGAASGAVVDVNCRNTVGDAAALTSAIGASATGDSILIHGTCLVNQTAVLHGDRRYTGDSRTGRRASSARR